MLYINILKHNMDPSILLPWDQADLFLYGTTVYLSVNLTLQLYIQLVPVYIPRCDCWRWEGLKEIF